MVRMVEVYWGEMGQAYVTPVGTEEICVATVARDPAIRMEAVLESLPALRAASCRRGRAEHGTRSAHHHPKAAPGDGRQRCPYRGRFWIRRRRHRRRPRLSFRQALLLAEAIAADNLAIYEAGHPAILRMPHLMSRVMLRMDAWPWMREGALGLLSAQPQLFTHLLASISASGLWETSCLGICLRWGFAF